METKTYNGWTNYETWAVALWMDNEKGTYDNWREIASGYLKDSMASDVFNKEEQATLDLIDEIKESFIDGIPDLGACTYTDLLNSALSEVNWHEIAKNLIEEVQ